MPILISSSRQQLDDMEDAEMIDLLVEGSPPVHLVAVTTQLPPGVPTETIVTNLQMFTRVWRAKVPTILSHNVFNHYFDKLLQVGMCACVCRVSYLLYYYYHDIFVYLLPYSVLVFSVAICV